MKTSWSTTILVGFITVTGFRMLFVPAEEVQHVQFGSTVTLTCNISYLYDTTWLKHNPDLTPTVVLCTGLKEGHPVLKFQVSSRHSVSLRNRSLALSISGVEENDLGLYYCMSNANSCLVVGSGTIIQVTDFPRLPFRHWYCICVGSGLLIMVLAVCISCWKAKSKEKKENRQRQQ